MSRRQGARPSARPPRLPATTLAGVAVIVVGLALDVGYHVFGSAPRAAPPCCGIGWTGHVVTLAGMVLALAGVIGLAVKGRARSRAGAEGGERARADLAVG